MVCNGRALQNVQMYKLNMVLDVHPLSYCSPFFHLSCLFFACILYIVFHLSFIYYISFLAYVIVSCLFPSVKTHVFTIFLKIITIKDIM